MLIAELPQIIFTPAWAAAADAQVRGDGVKLDAFSSGPYAKKAARASVQHSQTQRQTCTAQNEGKALNFRLQRLVIWIFSPYKLNYG